MSWTLGDIVRLSIHQASSARAPLKVDVYDDYIERLDREPWSLADKIVAFAPIAFSLSLLLFLVWITS